MDILFCFFLCFAAAFAFPECGKKGSASRIIGGVDAGHGEFPWQISLRLMGRQHICGGTLISKQWVLSAAHCFASSQQGIHYKVRVGEWKLQSEEKSEKDYEVEFIEVHHLHNWPRRFYNDIALVKLKNPVDFSGPYAGTACMPAMGDDYRGHENCFLSGWGLMGPNYIADTLQKVTGKIWNQEALKKEWGTTLPPKAIGFGEPGRWNSCMGDSGGPLVCPNANGSYDVVGVVSFGPSDCWRRPAVFTEVAAYRDWIEERTGESFEKNSS